MINLKNFIIILVNTQLPENLGATARSMLNFGLTKLRIVSPRFDLKNEKILPVAVGADKVIDNAEYFDTFEDSIKDINFLVACTARKRTFNKKVLSIQKACDEMNIKSEDGNKIGIIFGPENSGLTNEHLSFVDRILIISSNPSFSSLNLSHAVILICYELFNKQVSEFNSSSKKEKFVIASKNDLINFFFMLEKLLHESGFFKTSERERTMVNKLRNIFNRMDLTKNEIDSLMGIINSLARNNKNIK